MTEPTVTATLDTLAGELVTLWTKAQDLEEPPLFTVANETLMMWSDLDDGLEIHQDDTGMLVVHIHYNGPELGDVHEMQFDFSSAVHAPQRTAEVIVTAAFG